MSFIEMLEEYFSAKEDLKSAVAWGVAYEPCTGHEGEPFRRLYRIQDALNKLIPTEEVK